MTLRIVDGWDYHTGAQGMFQKQGWTGDTDRFAMTTSTAFGYGKAMGFGATTTPIYTYRTLRNRYTTGGVIGQRMFVHTDAGKFWFIKILDNNSTFPEQFYVQFDSNGAIWVYGINSGTDVLLAKTYSNAFNPGAWFFFEMKWDLGSSTTTGTLEIRVNTETVLSLSAADLINGTLIAPATLRGFDMMMVGTVRFAPLPFNIDDFYFLTTDGALNNNFLGNVRAKYLALTGNSTPLNFLIGGTAPAATNWQSSLNTALDDTKYVYSPTAGDQDLYTIDPNLNTPFVHGLELSGAFRQDDATQRFVANTIKSGAANGTGATHAVNQSYYFYNDVFELDPATGVQFTGAGANALKVGPKVIT